MRLSAWGANRLQNKGEKIFSLTVPLRFGKCYMTGRGPYLANVPPGTFQAPHLR